LYAIEVKFIHPSNARQINMVHEVIKDDQKLRLAHHHSNGFIKPINLVFCSSPTKESRGGIKAVIDHIKEYIIEGITTDRNNKIYHHPKEVATIFIESFIDEDAIKKTVCPIANIPGAHWAMDAINIINSNKS